MKLLFFDYLKLHTMSLIPLDREHMRLLHSRKLDQLFKHRIDQIATVIYKNAISTAEHGELKYFYCLPSIHPKEYALLAQDISIHPTKYTSDAVFVRKHMDHILEKVRFLFDGCSVEHRTIALVKSRDGKDIELSVDDKLKHMFSRIEPKEYIVVDWS